MSYGTPCLVSDLPANRDLIEEGVTGRMVPVGDVGALAEAILNAIENPSVLSPLATAARRRVESRFSLGVVAEAYEQLYLKLTGR